MSSVELAAKVWRCHKIYIYKNAICLLEMQRILEKKALGWIKEDEIRRSHSHTWASKGHEKGLNSRYLILKCLEIRSLLNVIVVVIALAISFIIHSFDIMFAILFFYDFLTLLKKRSKITFFVVIDSLFSSYYLYVVYLLCVHWNDKMILSILEVYFEIDNILKVKLVCCYSLFKKAEIYQNLI